MSRSGRDAGFARVAGSIVFIAHIITFHFAGFTPFVHQHFTTSRLRVNIFLQKELTIFVRCVRVVVQSTINKLNDKKIMKTEKTPTQAQKLLKKIRDGHGNGVAVTGFYWGTAADYNNGKYNFWDYCPKFGGMQSIRSRYIAARAILACGDDLDHLTEIIQPRRDTSPGDPQNYAPHSSEMCELEF